MGRYKPGFDPRRALELYSTRNPDSVIGVDGPAAVSSRSRVIRVGRASIQLCPSSFEGPLGCALEAERFHYIRNAETSP